jgi:hypothetical protein
MTRIIGLDPGLRNSGWGVIESEGSRLIYVADGAVHSDANAPLAERLLQIHEQILRVLKEFVPDEAAIEETFVNTDARATLKLGQARGRGSRPRRQGAGQTYGETSAAPRRNEDSGLNRRLGHRHLSRASSRPAKAQGHSRSFLTCSRVHASNTCEVLPCASHPKVK